MPQPGLVRKPHFASHTYTSALKRGSPFLKQVPNPKNVKPRGPVKQKYQSP